MLLDFDLLGILEIEYDDSKSLMLTAKRVLESNSTSLWCFCMFLF